MKKHIICFLLLFNSLFTFGQSFLGKVTKQVNFREGPSKESSVIGKLQAGTQIFIISLDSENDFYNIIDIASNKEGYIHKSFIKIGQEVEKNEKGYFTPNGKSETVNPEIEIFNNTDLTLTLKLNNQKYIFYSQEKRTIELSPGSCNYRASAPEVIPNFGNEYLVSNQAYTWQFYIVNERR